MAGYSGTPLVQKLGIKPGHRVAFLQAPRDFGQVLGPLPDGVNPETVPRAKGPFDVIVLFTKARSDLVRHFSTLASRLSPAGGFWIAWPKRTSGVASDLTEDVIRVIGLDEGLVDNKVCAIDETWSGLRFVIRLHDRPRKARR